ncbi:MAG: hypothetical protein QHH06_13820 [Clostridiales bacterium]|jgi:hypothetical protein|nr:hypothetical protein [Eubacteriales bacterium]MDH7567520.1 hypothetical protein [Clostridiales bacterium]
MKKLITVLTTSAILAMLISGCGSGVQSQTGSGTPEGTAASSSTGSTNSPSSTGGGQRQFARPDLSGEVASISGNQVTLKLIEIPAPRRNSQQGANGQAQNGSSATDQGTGQPRQRNITYTGQTQTISIPDGTQITTTVRGQNAREEKAIELKDIKQGDILQIWYSDKDKQTISRISVMEASGNSGQSSQSSQNSQSTQN